MVADTWFDPIYSRGISVGRWYEIGVVSVTLSFTVISRAERDRSVLFPWPAEML